jgi:hypothetical protein
VLWTIYQLLQFVVNNIPTTTNYSGQHPSYHKLLWTTSQLPQTTVDNFPPTTYCYRFACSIQYSSPEVHKIYDERRRISKLVTTQTGSLKARKQELDNKLYIYINVSHSRTFQSTYFDFFISNSDKNITHKILLLSIYRGAGKSLARPRRKQATATEDFDVHIYYL